MDFNRTETRALLLGTGLLLLGAAARLGFTPGPADLQWRGSVPAGGSSRTLTETRRRVEARLRDEERASKPLEAGERINPNTASEVELRRLPGVGPTRASAIVAERLAGGPFQHLEDLTRVPGIGPATIASLAPALTLPPHGGTSSGAAGRRPAPRTFLIDVNRAQINELEQITGVGPVLAARIVDVRRRIGRFRGPEDLLHVPGIGPGILQRIRGEVRF